MKRKQSFVVVVKRPSSLCHRLPLPLCCRPNCHPFLPAAQDCVFVHRRPARQGPSPHPASSLTHLSLFASTISPPKISFKYTISANPLQSPLTLGPHRFLNPSGPASLHRTSIVSFRSDLHVHDNECLDAAHNESMPILNVYCFNPRTCGNSTLGFNKTGPYCASFLFKSISDLRRSLRDRGSDLMVRVGCPEEVLSKMAKAVGPRLFTPTARCHRTS